VIAILPAGVKARSNGIAAIATLSGVFRRYLFLHTFDATKDRS